MVSASGRFLRKLVWVVGTGWVQCGCFGSGRLQQGTPPPGAWGVRVDVGVPNATVAAKETVQTGPRKAGSGENFSQAPETLWPHVCGTESELGCRRDEGAPSKTEALPLVPSQSLTFTLIVTHSAIVFLTLT